MPDRDSPRIVPSERQYLMIHRIALVLPILIACGTSGSPTGIEDAACPPTSTLTYANFGQDVIDTNCLDCHAGKESPNLSTQAAIQRHASKILDMAVYTDAMPERASMPLAQREMLGEWLACG